MQKITNTVCVKIYICSNNKFGKGFREIRLQISVHS